MKVEELDWFMMKILTEEMSRPCGASLVWALVGGLGIGLPPIMNFGSEELKQKCAYDILHAKKVIALAITEP